MGQEFFHPQRDAVPEGAVEVTAVQDRILPADRLTIELFFDHQDCLEADRWRNEGGTAFPPFKAVLHERYNRNRTHLKCEACGTVISHTMVNATIMEST